MDSAPLICLFQYKENYKHRLIQKLLTEDLRLALKGKRLGTGEVELTQGYPNQANHLRKFLQIIPIGR